MCLLLCFTNIDESYYWVVRINDEGVIQWQKCLSGTDNNYAHSGLQTIDGGYIVAGHTHSNDGDVTDNNGYTDFWIVKLEAG
ncbi:MAG: hypothetical protein U9O65_00600 [Thermotogota bacterium]|nr:hypothetical protein [Thermotogota bacterium]